MGIGNVFRTVAVINMPQSQVATLNKYIKADSTISSADYDELVTNVGLWYEDVFGRFDSEILAAVSLDVAEVYHVDDVTGEETILDDVDIDVTFSGSGDFTPHGAAVLISCQVFQDRGVLKWFIPGMMGARLDGVGNWDSVIATQGLLAVLDMLTAPDAVNGIDLDVGSWNSTTKTFKPVGSSGTVNLIPAYQRRRRPGVGI
ncbi:MAG: hypothetical protein [Circular genetic element sp.]|nr:MAG: hypothetical protein [Circular genetic element sp.]AXQ65327.1 MAG: hypothetical protein [Circular genetic element sp.]